MFVVYISPRKLMRLVQQFLFENLIIYPKLGSKILENGFGEKFDGVFMVLTAQQPLTKMCKSFGTAQILILASI